MANKKIDTQHDWEDHVVLSKKNIPDDIEGIISIASELLEISVTEALNFDSNDLDSVDAVDWLFYSHDSQPWSFGWVMSLLTTVRHEDFSMRAIASYRVDLLKNPLLLTAKQEFDLMISERRIQKNFSFLRTQQNQMDLLTGT